VGMLIGSLTLVDRTGKSNVWKITTFKNRNESLTLYERGRAGLEMKLLFREDGDKTFLYNALSAKLFQKNEEERYDNHLGTGFSFIDLSYYPYQSNYNPTLEKEQIIHGVTYLRVNLKPIVPYKYRKVIMFMNKSDLRPARLDFYDKSDILIKTMNIQYSRIKLKENKQSREVSFPSRFEMLDITNETTSFLEFQEIDRDVNLNKSLFEVANLNRSE
ncbi:MAG: outer membrane lipoprotein-sorting protein, partial [Leptospira sp.]|nr:outer membrane lipoprotein-sorting protein [Leptospira sp.]